MQNNAGSKFHSMRYINEKINTMHFYKAVFNGIGCIIGIILRWGACIMTPNALRRLIECKFIPKRVAAQLSSLMVLFYIYFLQYKAV